MTWGDFASLVNTSEEVTGSFHLWWAALSLWTVWAQHRVWMMLWVCEHCNLTQFTLVPLIWNWNWCKHTCYLTSKAAVKINAISTCANSFLLLYIQPFEPSYYYLCICVLCQMQLGLWRFLDNIYQCLSIDKKEKNNPLKYIYEKNRLICW